MVVTASTMVDSLHFDGGALAELRQQLHQYTQTFAFRQFFSNFLAISQREPMHAVALYSCFLEPSPGVFSAAFAYHAARVLFERVVLVEVGVLAADDSAYVNSVVGTHPSLRREREGVVDVVRSGVSREDATRDGSFEEQFEHLKSSHDLTIFVPSSLGLTESFQQAVNATSDASFVLCTPTQIRRKLVQRRVRELQEQGMRVKGCIVVESGVGAGRE